MTLSELDRKRRALPVFQRAIAVERRLTDAIGLGSVHQARLRKLRSYVQEGINHYSEREMYVLLAHFEVTFETEIAAAERSEDDSTEALACERVTVFMTRAA